MKTLRPYQQKALQSILTSSGDVIAEMSVGAGKSLTIAELLRINSDMGKYGICLTMTRELVQQNYDEFTGQGYTGARIYCSAIRKQWGGKYMFASPQSLIGALKKENHYLAKNAPDLIVIDECHNVNDRNEKSTYMQIINHYRSLKPDLRVVGLTGTPYRDGENHICGDDRLFKESVTQVSIQHLIEQGYLVKPVYVNHEGDEAHGDGFDFSDCTPDHLGNYKEEELNAVIHKDERLTGIIMREVEQKTRGKGGVFIFASTIQHCNECLAALPPGSAEIVTGKTKPGKRAEIMRRARNGEIRFLINVGVLTTGVNLPWFSNVVFVRPTSSRVLYLQAIGRGLRLHPESGKTVCNIYDYADNYETHGTHERAPRTSRIREIEEATSDLECPECNFMNKLTSRRCKGQMLGEQCTFFFQGKECPRCKGTNDITARYCRDCELELVNPNDKLIMADQPVKMVVNLKSTEFSTDKQRKKLNIIYTAANGSRFTESFKVDSQRLQLNQVLNTIFPRELVRTLRQASAMEIVEASENVPPIRKLRLLSNNGIISITGRVK